MKKDQLELNVSPQVKKGRRRQGSNAGDPPEKSPINKILISPRKRFGRSRSKDKILEVSTVRSESPDNLRSKSERYKFESIFNVSLEEEEKKEYPQSPDTISTVSRTRTAPSNSMLVKAANNMSKGNVGQLTKRLETQSSFVHFSTPVKGKQNDGSTITDYNLEIEELETEIKKLKLQNETKKEEIKQLKKKNRNISSKLDALILDSDASGASLSKRKHTYEKINHIHRGFDRGDSARISTFDEDDIISISSIRNLKRNELEAELLELINNQFAASDTLHVVAENMRSIMNHLAKYLKPKDLTQLETQCQLISSAISTLKNKFQKSTLQKQKSVVKIKTPPTSRKPPHIDLTPPSPLVNKGRARTSTSSSKRSKSITHVSQITRSKPKPFSVRSISEKQLATWDLPVSVSSESLTTQSNGKMNDKNQILEEYGELVHEERLLDSEIWRSDSRNLSFVISEDTNKVFLQSGKILAIFNWVMERSNDPLDREVFFIGYRKFVKPEGLLAFLSNKLKISQHSDEDISVMARTLLYWVENFHSDFEAKETRQQLAALLSSPPLLSYCDEILQLLEQQTTNAPPLEQFSLMNVKLMSSTHMTAKLELLSIPVVDLARQLTILEFDLLSKVNSLDLLTTTSRENSSSVKQLIERFNRVSNWVATEIVVTPNLKKRASVIKHFILVAQTCLEFQNYNTLLEITAGLNLSMISRLRKTWKVVPSKVVATLRSLEDLMDCQSNFGKYRRLLRLCELPALPYFGIFLRDFTFIDVGNNDFDHSDFVNFDKMRMNRDLVRAISRYQSEPYHFAVSPSLQNYLQNVSSFDEAALQKYSIQCEPASEI